MPGCLLAETPAQLAALLDREVRPRLTRGQLRSRLAARVGRAYRRWLHPTSRRQPGETFL